MRRSRVSYEGAYHHIMSRGLEGKFIFVGKPLKEYFIKLLSESVKKYRIRLWAYAIMDNHYHLILQNSSGRLSDFMRYLNGNYAIFYRKQTGGSGYVFQNRYKSTLIQKDNYLTIGIVYVLMNPVRAGIVENPYDYLWSSLKFYFSGVGSDFIDIQYIEEIFHNKTELNNLLMEWVSKGSKLEIKKTRLGEILGSDNFALEVENNFNRRKASGKSMHKRKKDYILEPVERVIEEFEKQHSISIDKIDPITINGKILRDNLLVALKDKAGLKYTEIIKLSPFQTLKYLSLGNIYKRAKKRLKMIYD